MQASVAELHTHLYIAQDILVMAWDVSCRREWVFGFIKVKHAENMLKVYKEKAYIICGREWVLGFIKKKHVEYVLEWVLV